MKRQFAFTVLAETQGRLEIDVYDFIGDDWMDDSVTAKSVLAKLNGAPDARDILVRINSFGGILSDGKAIYNLLRERADAGARVEVRVDGIAASAASIIAMAGTTITVAANGFLMIHEGAAMAFGGASDMRGAAEIIERENAMMAEVYAAASARRGKNKKAAYFLEAMAAETYFDADQAIEAGLADGKAEEIKVAACLVDLTGENVPEALRRMPYATAGDFSNRLPTGQKLDASALRAAMQDMQARANKTTPLDGRAITTQAHRGEEDEVRFILLLKALGLPEAADEAQALSALSAIQDQSRANAATVAEYEAVTGLKGRESIGAISAYKTQAGEVPALKARVDAHEVEQKKTKVTAMLAKAKADGLVSPGEEPSLLTKGTEDPEWLAGNLAARSPVAINAETAAKQPVTAMTPVVLNELQLKACKAAGMTPDAYIAELKLRAAEGLDAAREI